MFTARIAILLATFLLFAKCSGHPSLNPRHGTFRYCEGCGEHCHDCKYGTVLSEHCHVLQCAKGPDEMCGGPFGQCADGLRCSTCSICKGCTDASESNHIECSITEDPCLPQLDSVLHNIRNRFGRLSTVM